MATPAITGFFPGSNIGTYPNQIVGLNSSNGSTNYVIITGDNMAQGLAVNVTTAGVSWSGSMGAYDGTQQGWPATLTCKNPRTGPGGTQDVVVTVGSGNETSSPVTFYRINVQSV